MSNELYNDLILSHNREPFHFDNRPDAHEKIRANNPVCGDRFDVFIEFPNDLSSLYFHGFGCALSKSSTSMLLQMIQGKTFEEALIICKKFLSYLEGQSSTDIKEFLAFSGVFEHPARMDCVKLSWIKMKGYLENHISKR